MTWLPPNESRCLTAQAYRLDHRFRKPVKRQCEAPPSTVLVLLRCGSVPNDIGHLRFGSSSCLQPRPFRPGPAVVRCAALVAK